MVGKVFEFPFDTIKVRLQSQPDNKPLEFKGPLDCFRKSIKADGLGGLYRGISPPLVGAAAETSALFFSYNLIQRLITSTFYGSSTGEDVVLGLPTLALCGAASGAFASFILTPIELIKCKMQVQAIDRRSSSSQSTTPFHTSTNTQNGVASLHKIPSASLHTTSTAAAIKPGPVALISEVIRVYGVRGLWLGQTGTFLRETGGSAAWFGSYEYISRTFRRLGGNKDKNTAGEMMLSGAAAGVSYNFILFPADTIKSRMQTEAVGVKGEKVKGFATVGKELYTAGGLRALYRGCGITVARSAPASAIIFLTYETLKELF